MSNQPTARMDWIEKKVTMHKNRLYRTALAIMGNKSDAEDIVQDVFVKLFERQQQFESAEHETAWLIRVTVNLCKTRLRSPWRKKTVQLLEAYPAQTEEQHSIIETVALLPPKYRTVIHLFYYEGYTTKEISVITSQKESTVREQLTRARRRLKVFLEDDMI